jgi:hypothetical protein
MFQNLFVTLEATNVIQIMPLNLCDGNLQNFKQIFQCEKYNTKWKEMKKKKEEKYKIATSFQF